MITIYGRATSGNVQIAMWAIGELGLKHERLDVGGKFGGTDTPQYATMNPNRLVPTMKDGELVLWESAAIVRYLAATYGSDTFWPKAPAARARADQWAEWTKTTFQPTFISGVFGPLVFTPEAKRDPAAIAAAAAKVKPLAGMIDAHLAELPYVGGNELSFGDCIFGTVLFRYFTLDGFERAETPHLRAYYDRLTERPAYRQHAMVEYDSMRAR
ncbi:MAG: glutathione S-transferase N-terminal domain-containing protein [Rhizobiaceae bacterium]|nr:glutathione S-transferase N-terminal domain-containing protein [Rhizobiaceae bacterium]